jgi:predicted DNA-binding mobile mystery protein A
MKKNSSILVLRQVDRKILRLPPLKDVFVPEEGWIKLIRTALNMSLRQLAERLSVSPQNIRKLELSEKEGSISLKSLRETAQALDMQLVYGFVPKDGSLEALLESKALKLATSIVLRTSNSMKLEDQENTPSRIKDSIEELTQEIKKEMSKKLWD